MKISHVVLSVLALAVATHSTAGRLVYGLKSTSSATVPSVAPTNLFLFDGSAGGTLDIGPVTYGSNQVNADGLAWGGGTLYAFLIEPNGSRLVTINPTTAVATNVAFYGGVTIRGATYRSGKLYALDVLVGSSWRVATIDLSTQILTSTPLSITISDACDLDFAASGELWVAEANAFHKLDPLTGVLTFVSADNMPEEAAFVFMAGFAFDETSPFRCVNYDANFNEDLYSYQLPNPLRSTIQNNILPNFNAGRGDLAAVPEPATLTVLGVGLLAFAKRRRMQ